jgi:hypothetical protein
MFSIIIIIIFLLTITRHTTATTTATTTTNINQQHSTNPNTILPSSTTSIVGLTAEKQVLEWGIHQCQVILNKIKWPIPTSLGLRGVVASKPISQGEVIIVVPEKCHLQLRNSPAHVKKFIRKIPQHLRDNTDDFIEMVVFLTELKLNPNTTSFWTPYINILPKDLDTPTHSWSEEEINQLQFQDEIDNINDRIREKHSIYDGIILIDSRFTRNWTFEIFSWAWTIIESRAWHRPPNNKERVLIPFIDFLNHASNVMSVVRFKLLDDDSSEIAAVFESAAMNIGDEILNNYGFKDGHDTLFYGFAILDNLDENFNVEVEYWGEKFNLLLRWYPRHNITGVIHLLDELLFDSHPSSYYYLANSHKKQHDVEDILSTLSTILQEILFNFPTSLKYDENLLQSTSNDRLKDALHFRITRKKLLQRHLELFNRLKDVIVCSNSLAFFHDSTTTTTHQHIQFLRIRRQIIQETIAIDNRTDTVLQYFNTK